jgi:hypothetical protein
MSQTKKAKVVVFGSYRAQDKTVKQFSDLAVYIPENRAGAALSAVRGVLKKHLRKFFPDGKSLRKVSIKEVESSSLESMGKPVDVMSLEELVYVIENRDMHLQPEIFPTLGDLRHAVKLYLNNEDEALSFVNSKKKQFQEEREIMELNPQLKENATSYLDPGAVKNTKKVRAQKPEKDFHKPEIKNLDTDVPDDGDFEEKPEKELSHEELIIRAKELKIPGNVKTMKPETLQRKIKEAEDNDDF